MLLLGYTCDFVLYQSPFFLFLVMDLNACGMVSKTIVPVVNPINVPIAEPFLMIPMLAPSSGPSLLITSLGPIVASDLFLCVWLLCCGLDSH